MNLYRKILTQVWLNLALPDNEATNGYRERCIGRLKENEVFSPDEIIVKREKLLHPSPKTPKTTKRNTALRLTIPNHTITENTATVQDTAVTESETPNIKKPLIGFRGLKKNKVSIPFKEGEVPEVITLDSADSVLKCFEVTISHPNKPTPRDKDRLKVANEIVEFRQAIAEFVRDHLESNSKLLELEKEANRKFEEELQNPETIEMLQNKHERYGIMKIYRKILVPLFIDLKLSGLGLSESENAKKLRASLIEEISNDSCPILSHINDSINELQK